MYGIFTYKNGEFLMVNVGKYTSTIEYLGTASSSLGSGARAFGSGRTGARAAAALACAGLGFSPTATIFPGRWFLKGCPKGWFKRQTQEIDTSAKLTSNTYSPNEIKN